MDRAQLVRRVQYAILQQLDAGDRLGQDGAIRAASLADAVLAEAAGASAAELVRDAKARLDAARDEWRRSAEDPGGFGAAALDEIARELERLLAEIQSA